MSFLNLFFKREFLLSVGILCSVAAVAQTYSGSTTLKNQKLDKITLQGMAELENVQGSHLDVIGTANLQNVNVSGLTTVRGAAEFKQCVLENLEVLGDFSFDSLTVHKKTTLHGMIEKGANGHFHELEVMGRFTVKKKAMCEGPFKIYGPMTVTHFTAKSPGEIIGSVVAKKSQFDALTLTAQEMEFSDCQIKAIKVKSLTSASEPQVLHLKGKTQVAGDILFESGKGIVILEKKAKIQGLVQGAKIQEK